MGTRQIRTTADFHRAKANARVVCLGCQRVRIVHARTLALWFIVPVQVETAARRMRCSQCGHRGAKLSPVPM
jgi:transcription elongation factor Elf1